MKISPCTNYNVSYKSTDKTKSKIARLNTVIEKNKIAVQGGFAAILLGGLLWKLTGKSSAIKAVNGNILLSSAKVNMLKKQMREFASDVDYRKDLLKAIKCKAKDYALLRPIAGPEEYKNIVKEFSESAEHYSPGKALITNLKDGFDMSGKMSTKFRANMHMHTIHSDGKMTVKELLDQSAQYADEVATKAAENAKSEFKAKHAPFTIAITDHDTVEGCKEAVEIISADPWKYRNLRVVLGCELSVESKMVPQELKKPVPIHMLVHGINPFDETLNKFLNDKKTHRIDLIKNIIKQSTQKILQTYPETAAKLTYEDSKPLYPFLNYGITHVDASTKDYIQFRTIFSECFEQNTFIQNALKNKGISKDKITYTAPSDKYFGKINNDFGSTYWKKYEEALKKYVAELLNLSDEAVSKEIVITPKMEAFFDQVERISNETKPKLELSPAFIDMEQAINFIKSQKHGYMSIAHPGLTDIGKCLKNPEQSMQAMSDLFTNFKEKGMERALSAEIHYHYFGALADSKDWLNSFNVYAKANKLYFGGGLDSHGSSIFYSAK